jgi:cellulose synthase/poly-beta-1,6-N-acetylglucosamine synthase-like glycosyltransferase
MSLAIRGPSHWSRGVRDLPPEPTRLLPRRRDVESDDVYLNWSIRGLEEMAPEMSARRTLSSRQRQLGIGILLLIGFGLLVYPLQVLVAANTLAVLLYSTAFVYSVVWFRSALHELPLVTVSDEEARAIPDHVLPKYTILVAAYHESEVIGETIRALERLDYPPDRLDVKLLLESDDQETIQAARQASPASHIRIVRVPRSEPRTKPKACNYGLCTATGDLVTIYDAEDRPEPLQLRRAAVAFSRLEDDVACLQAKLHYYNWNQNVITRLFSAEYITWFSLMLPALLRLKTPVPLGGTSMHLRRDMLEHVGAWDAHNVTEDADLGVRLARFGFRTLILDSVTLEEANSDFINWVKQRSRWHKGYMQTWLVHMRNPFRLHQDLGLKGFWGFQLTLAVTPLLALLNPIFWFVAALWLVAKPPLVAELFPPILYYPAMLCLVLGNFLGFYRTAVGLRLERQPGLFLSIFAQPLYWVMMAIAAIRALLQLVVAPSFWEKTLHGLDESVGVSKAV